MLESSSFDFRNRYPQKHLVKLINHIKLDRDIGKTAYSILIDLYRTFAPLKQTSATMCFAAVELATILSERQQDLIRGEGAPQYRKWSTSRVQILETIMDLLDLYTHFQKNTIVGPSYHIDRFIQIQLQTKSELDSARVARYTEFHEPPKSANGRLGTKTPQTPITPASPADALNGTGISPTSPRSAGSGRRGSAGRSQEGTVRFMLDSGQAKKEKDTVAEYFKVEYEEYEVEVEEPIKPEREERGPRHYNNFHHRGHRDDRPYYRGGRGGRR
jgi:CTD kinase subunit beta